MWISHEFWQSSFSSKENFWEKAEDLHMRMHHMFSRGIWSEELLQPSVFLPTPKAHYSLCQVCAPNTYTILASANRTMFNQKNFKNHTLSFRYISNQVHYYDSQLTSRGDSVLSNNKQVAASSSILVLIPVPPCLRAKVHHYLKSPRTWYINPSEYIKYTWLTWTAIPWGLFKTIMDGSWHINSHFRTINLIYNIDKNKKPNQFQNLVQHQTANEFAFFFATTKAFSFSRLRWCIIVYRQRKVNSISYIQRFLSCHLQESETKTKTIR